MPIEYVDLFAADAAARREADLYSPAEIFMESTRLYPYQAGAVLRGARALDADPDRRRILQQSCKTYASSPRVHLARPSTTGAGVPFDALMAAAASPAPQRLTGAPIEADQLSRLLFYGYGVGGGTVEETPPSRTSPSAAGIYPLELYVVAISVQGVEAGVYHFNAWLHCLEKLRKADVDESAALVHALVADGDAGGAAAAIVATAIPLRTCEAHGERGYRIVLLEAGQVGQSLHLGALALGLAARQVTHFYDNRVDALLEVDGVDELTVAVHLVGVPDPGECA